MLGLDYNHYHYNTFRSIMSQEKNVTYYASKFWESLAHGYARICASSGNDDHISHVDEILMHAMLW